MALASQARVFLPLLIIKLIIGTILPRLFFSAINLGQRNIIRQTKPPSALILIHYARHHRQAVQSSRGVQLTCLLRICRMFCGVCCRRRLDSMSAVRVLQNQHVRIQTTMSHRSRSTRKRLAAVSNVDRCLVLELMVLQGR